MKIVLTAETALNYWRTHDLSSTEPTRAISLQDASATSESLQLIAEVIPAELAERPIKVLVGDRQSRRRVQGLNCVVWSGDLPPYSLRRISDDIYVSSPEMCFLQFCSKSSRFRAIQYGMELCGSYALGLDGKGAVYGRQPLTNKARLSFYLEQCDRKWGVKPARMALPHVNEGSASPLETIVTMLLCMPLRDGGYGLPAPDLNKKIGINAAASELTEKQYYKCDLMWPDKQVALEYNSTEFHADATSMNQDYHRSNVLSYLDVTVVLVTWPMVRDPKAFDELCVILAHHLGHRMRTRMNKKTILQARSLLRKDIMRPLVAW